MYEHESDILVAEPETETTQKTFEKNQSSGDNLFEVVYEPTKKQTKPEKKQDVFATYNSNHLNKVYKKYDVVQTYVPKNQQKNQTNASFEKFVEQQDSFQPQQETFMVQNIEPKQQFKLKPKAKVWLVSFSVIIIMLCSLCIFNAVSIGNLNGQIEQTTSSITDINKAIQTTVKEYGELTDEGAVKDKAEDMGLGQVEPENSIEITLNEKNVIEDYQGQTNFFDEICKFVRSLFGG